MRAILHELKLHVKEDFHPRLYLYTFLFLTAAFVFNYSTGFVHHVLDAWWGSPWCIVYYSLFFFLAWFGIALPKLVTAKSTDVFLKAEFWIKTIVILLLLGTIEGIDYRLDYDRNTENENFYLTAMAGNLRSFVLIILPFFVLYRLYYRKAENFFGMSFRSLPAGPFLGLLLLMLPVILAASFFPAFLETYPIFRTWLAEPVFGINVYWMAILYESAYVLDLLSVEWIFRGIMAIGLGAVMGRHAILPMAVCYTFLHFGKPAAEAIGSFFGGYILGVLALKWNSIKGGFIVHAGVAMTMEFCGYLQHFLFGNDA